MVQVKSDNGKVEMHLQGDIFEIMSDLTVITNRVLKTVSREFDQCESFVAETFIECLLQNF